MGLESHIELLVASRDLELGQPLRDAIRTTELGGAQTQGLLGPAIRAPGIEVPTPPRSPRWS